MQHSRYCSNGRLLIEALSCFGAVLTLPGIAGTVLTVGDRSDDELVHIGVRFASRFRLGMVEVGANCELERRSCRLTTGGLNLPDPGIF